MRRLLIATAVLAIVAALALLGTRLFRGETAAHGPIPQGGPVDLVGIDMNTTGNGGGVAGGTLGVRETCGTISGTGTLTIDITADEIPQVTSEWPGPGSKPGGGDAGAGISGFAVTLNFNPAVVTVTGHSMVPSLLGLDPDSSVVDGSTSGVGTYTPSAVDFGNLGADNPPFVSNNGSSESGEGVLARLTLQGVASGTSTLTMTGVGIADDSAAPHPINYVASAIVVVDGSCPDADLSVVQTLNPPGPVTASIGTDVDVDVDKDIDNAGPLDDVAGTLTTTVTIPAGCHAQPYGQPGSNVSGPGDLVISQTVPPPPYGLLIGAGHSMTEKLTLRCSDPGLHIFTIENEIQPIGATGPTNTTSDTFTLTATAFEVDHTGDASDANPGNGVCATAGAVCTLRAAIEEANAYPGPDGIVFNILPAGSKLIQPASALDTIDEQVIIDGTTQDCTPGAPPCIELDGTNAGTDGLHISAGSSTVKGFIIVNFSRNGILIDTLGGNLIEGNLIGTDATGTAGLGNLYGVHIDGAPSNTIGGAAGTTPGGPCTGACNVISGNWIHGVLIQDSAATGNAVLGNFIGTNPAGGAALPNGWDGVSIQVLASSTTVGGLASGAGNVISGNGQYGVYVRATDNNEIFGNFIGTNAAGNAAVPNTLDGVHVDLGASTNTVGGTAAGAGNLISGNGSDGVEINGSGTINNEVLGNYIGTRANGSDPLGNTENGVFIDNAGNNTIGGNTTEARNVISGNDKWGVFIGGGTATLNEVEGNYIGTNAAGNASVPNTYSGVLIYDGASSNMIGGATATPGTPPGNVISGNDKHGVNIQSPSTGSNQVQGNLIGMNAAGSSALRNLQDGVLIIDASDNTVGGSTAAERNVISGNSEGGVEIRGASATDNHVEGNYIGTDVTGASDRGNTLDGVLIDGAPGNFIGAAAATAGAPPGNVISGNNSDGVEINGTDATGNEVQGNLIGTDVTAALDRGNSSYGVNIRNLASSNTVGGTAGTTPGGPCTGMCNVISGNNWDGVYITGTDTTDNLVQGNYIGTDASGTADLGNGYRGVVTNGAPSNTIGGATPEARNVISGNDADGVYLTGSGSQYNKVQGNYIGIDVTGTADLGNSDDGVRMWGANRSTIGGTAAGEGNVISGNDQNGVYIHGTVPLANEVEGNFIGTNAAGTADLGNSGHGMFLDDAANNTIGGQTGTTPGGPCTGACNVISGNDSFGIWIEGASATNNTVEGNYIGTDTTGALDRGNNASGVVITDGAHGNTIGGTTTAERNVISGNNNHGVLITVNAPDNFVQGNYIGTTAAGTGSLGNSLDGVRIYSSLGNIVGGAALAGVGTPPGNVISGNGSGGVEISSGSDGTDVLGNRIGVDVNGDPASNGGPGVLIVGSSNVTIGTKQAGEGNTIAFNGGAGVYVSSGTGITIDPNSTHSNGELGIDLAPTGVTPNDPGDSDTGANDLQNFPVLTKVGRNATSVTVEGELNSTLDRTYRLEFFSNSECDASGNGEGETFVGSTTVTIGPSGPNPEQFNETFSATVANGEVITATATDESTNNTSEFSTCDDCASVATAWNIPPGDGDCDGFTDAAETFMGSDPLDECPNNMSHDAWPPDFNNNKSVDIFDVLMIKPYFGSPGSSPYSARHDVQGQDGDVDIFDVLAIKPYFTESCT